MPFYRRHKDALSCGFPLAHLLQCWFSVSSVSCAFDVLAVEVVLEKSIGMTGTCLLDTSVGVLGEVMLEVELECQSAGHIQ